MVRTREFLIACAAVAVGASALFGIASPAPAMPFPMGLNQAASEFAVEPVCHRVIKKGGGYVWVGCENQGNMRCHQIGWGKTRCTLLQKPLTPPPVRCRSGSGRPCSH